MCVTYKCILKGADLHTPLLLVEKLPTSEYSFHYLLICPPPPPCLLCQLWEGFLQRQVCKVQKFPLVTFLKMSKWCFNLFCGWIAGLQSNTFTTLLFSPLSSSSHSCPIWVTIWYGLSHLGDSFAVNDFSALDNGWDWSHTVFFLKLRISGVLL